MNMAPEIKEYENYKIRPIGIFARNREEWVLLDLAAIFYGFVTTCFYSTMPEIQFSIKIAGLSTMFGSKEWLDVLLQLEGSYETLKTYVCFDKFEEVDYNKAKAKGIELVAYDRVLDEGKKNLVDYKKIEIKPDDLMTFVFTSGTTGKPKCTMISNKNMQSFMTG